MRQPTLLTHGMIFIALSICGCTSRSLPPDEPEAASPLSNVKVQHFPEDVGDLAGESAGIAIYVEPFYNSIGPRVDVGAYSRELAESTRDSISQLAVEMKADWDHLRVEAMYVLSIRLYDFGLKDEAVYWFYSAQFRAMLFESVVVRDPMAGIGSEDFERIHAHRAFHQLAGGFINGYAFGELGKLEETIRLVQKESGEALPDLKDAYPALEFIPEDQWPAKNEKIANGMNLLLDYIQDNEEQIRRERKEKGVEGKY